MLHDEVAIIHPCATENCPCSQLHQLSRLASTSGVSGVNFFATLLSWWGYDPSPWGRSYPETML
jgi:hypothetical protein